MAIKTNAELTAQNNAAIRVNGNREITPPKHNEINKNIFDSYLNIKDGGQVVQYEAGYSSALTLTSSTSFVYKSWVESLVSSLGTYLGLWDANTNTPTITSGVGTNGDWYYVSVAGTTTIDGISTWNVGDKIIFNGTAWERITSFVDLSLGVTGILPVANGGTGQSDYTLRDNTNEYSIDWANRNLFDALGDLSVDYTGKTLLNGTATVLNWATGLLNDLNGVGVQSIDFNNRELYNNSGTRTVDYGNRLLYYGSGQASYDWSNNLLLYSNGNTSISANDGSLNDSSGNTTLHYSDKEFRSLWSFISGNELRFNDTDNSNYVGIKAPTNVTTNYTISLPSAPPSSGQYLGYNGTDYVWNTITSGLTYLGTWNANTNTPTITSGVGSNGQYYIVSVAGTTTIDGINDWGVGDWIMFNGTAWQKIDNSDRVSSVNGYTGAVVLTTTDINEGTNLYYTNARGIGSVLTGYVSGAGTVAATDTILQAIQKLNGNQGLYALLDGSNTPFTGAIRFQPTSGTAVTAKAFSTQPIYVGRDSSNVERFRVNSTGLIDVYSTTNNFFFRAFAGSNELNIQEFSSRWILQGDSRPITFSFINNMTFSLRATTGNFVFGNDFGNGVVINTINSQNTLVSTNGIKIGNNTDTAATAGGGSQKYVGGIFYGSDGSNWNAFLTASNLKTQSKTTDIADITAGNALTGTAYWIKITADNSGDVDRIGCFVTSAAAENIYLGIYSNAGSKLADATVSSGSVVAGINTATLSSTVTLVAGTEYWLCVKDNNSGSVNLGYQTCLANSNICKSLFVGAGSLPANDTGATAATSAFHIFVFKS